MSAEHIGKYEKYFSNFIKTFTSIKREDLKRDGFRILRYYMTCFYLEIIAPLIDINKREDILLNVGFMTKITDALSNDIDNYHESVKEEA